MAAGGHVSDSGFVADPTVPSNPGNTSDFKLRITTPGNTLLGDESFSTPYTSGDPFIFSATGTGTYRLRVDGGVDGPGGAAYYDIRISTLSVPGPVAGAGLPGLIAAFGGFLAWRKRRLQAPSTARTLPA